MPGALGGQKKASKALGLELQKAMSCQVGTEPGSSGRIASALTAEPSLQPTQLFLYLEIFYFSP